MPFTYFFVDADGAYGIFLDFIIIEIVRIITGITLTGIHILLTFVKFTGIFFVFFIISACSGIPITRHIAIFLRENGLSFYNARVSATGFLHALPQKIKGFCFPDVSIRMPPIHLMWNQQENRG